jgi:hypothetical protein
MSAYTMAMLPDLSDRHAANLRKTHDLPGTTFTNMRLMPLNSAEL